ncbi:MAG: serine/threonine-protein phosphatase [Betaproteobacteria bacterium]|nr:serine/threonine-protein phosphatase [Betaproteobacteria bacterium]
MKFSIFQESRIGQRKSNQDRLCHHHTQDALLMVVADGMGGHLMGDVAAQIAVDHFGAAFTRQAQPSLADPLQFLSGTLADAHQAIFRFALEHSLPEIPCTTCVACVVQHGIAYWAHAGDSRLYLIRAGQVLTRTRDHTQVQKLLEQGLIDAAAAAAHPARNRIYSCLGGEQPPHIEVARAAPLKHGDIVALCTDGAWGPLPDDTLVRELSVAEPARAVPLLLNMAEVKAGGASDNLTLMVMQWEDNCTGQPGL